MLFSCCLWDDVTPALFGISEPYFYRLVRFQATRQDLTGTVIFVFVLGFWLPVLFLVGSFLGGENALLLCWARGLGRGRPVWSGGLCIPRGQNCPLVLRLVFLFNQVLPPGLGRVEIVSP